MKPGRKNDFRDRSVFEYHKLRRFGRRSEGLAKPAIIILGITLALAGCSNYHHWHQKLTVVVDTPSGPVSGSAVTEVEVWFGRVWLAATEAEYSLSGEATVVDLGRDRYLVALLDEHMKERLYSAVAARLPAVKRGEQPAPFPVYEGTVTLDRQNYPPLATFADPANPASGRLVGPSDLETVFGPGYALKAITMEVTDEPVTTGRVTGIFGWLSNPNVMNNPGWASLPMESRKVIGGLLSFFPDLPE